MHRDIFIQASENGRKEKKERGQGNVPAISTWLLCTVMVPLATSISTHLVSPHATGKNECTDIGWSVPIIGTASYISRPSATSPLFKGRHRTATRTLSLLLAAAYTFIGDVRMRVKEEAGKGRSKQLYEKTKEVHCCRIWPGLSL